MHALRNIHAALAPDGILVDTYARSKFEDTRRKAQKFGARGTTVKAYKPGP